MEGSLLEVTRDRDIHAEEIERLKKLMDEGKHSLSKVNNSLKETEARISEERAKNQKLSDKLKEKEK